MQTKTDAVTLIAALNQMRRELIREMWYPGSGDKTDIATVTACVAGINRYFDDTTRKVESAS